MKILLCTLNAKYIHLNLAIRLLYELNIDFEGLDWHEFTIKEDRDAIADHCSNYDVLAFSCYIWNISQTLDVARRIKQRKPDIKILLGGPEVSYDWQDVIARPEVDYIITGEGETPFQAFLQQYPAVQDVPGLVHKTKGIVQHNLEAAIFDLNNYRGINPYRHDAPKDLYNKVSYIETSRGCPYKCEFCLASLDNKVRYLPNETIKEHLLHLMTHGRVIKFLDRTFNIKRDFTIDIFQFILEHHRPENVFQFEITADILHPDIIRFIQEKVPVGLFRFEIGIQTVNQVANLEVSRKQNFDKTKGIIEALSDKVEMHLDLIVGLALDYWDDVKHSFEEVFKLFAPELQLGFLKFLKGTKMRDKLDQHGFVFDPEPPYQIIESKYLSREELFKLEVLEQALEIYWNKKRTPQLLKYVTARYSVFDFLLGLGLFFAERREFHQHTLTDIFEIAADFVATQYPDDPIMLQMLGADYYLYSKMRPKQLCWAEAAPEIRDALLRSLPPGTQKFRYFVLPLDFDYPHFERTQEIVPCSEPLVIAYNGREKAVWVGMADALQEG
jgi:anaerobic magnesium-protoporphyrin IX monomethyl ester cyclase